jgi:hypothetical protein
MDVFSKSRYSSKPFYSYPLRFLLNSDVQQLILVIILIWKMYYYFTTDKWNTWDVVNSTYKTTDYIVTIINNFINSVFLIILFIYFIGYIIYK